MNVTLPASFTLHERKNGKPVMVPVENIALARPARWGSGTCIWLRHGPMPYILVTEDVGTLQRLTNALAGQQ